MMRTGQFKQPNLSRLLRDAGFLIALKWESLFVDSPFFVRLLEGVTGSLGTGLVGPRGDRSQRD